MQVGEGLTGGTGTDKAVDKVTQPGLGDLLKNRGALIGTAMFLFQQLAGINAIIYFSSDVFAKVSTHFPLQSRPRALACRVVSPAAMMIGGTILRLMAVQKLQAACTQAKLCKRSCMSRKMLLKCIFSL